MQSPTHLDVGTPATVMVVGSASVRTEPDEAFVFLTITKTESAAGSALIDVARRGDALTAVLDELEVPTEDRSTTGITVNEEFDHTKEGRRTLGYRAATTLSVRLADMKLIGTLVMRCTEELDARIAGPSWRVSPDNAAWLDAASRAASNARDKAAAYAAGLGQKLGPLLALAEPTDVVMPRRSGSFRAASAGGDVPIETAEQEVTATIRATFALLPVS